MKENFTKSLYAPVAFRMAISAHQHVQIRSCYNRNNKFWEEPLTLLISFKCFNIHGEVNRMQVSTKVGQT
jgi:hypothetical protein